MSKPPRNDPNKQRADSALRDQAFFRARDEERQAGERKTERLRALRLAKEAAEREEAARVAAMQPPKPAKRARKAQAG